MDRAMECACLIVSSSSDLLLPIDIHGDVKEKQTDRHFLSKCTDVSKTDYYRIIASFTVLISSAECTIIAAGALPFAIFIKKIFGVVNFFLKVCRYIGFSVIFHLSFYTFQKYLIKF